MSAIKIKLEIIRAVAPSKPAGYESEVLASGVVIGESLVLERATYDRLRKKYSASNGAPWWLGIVKRFKDPSDTGPGDTIQRLVTPVGGETFKQAFKRVFGFDCGCARRQKQLNTRYPYRSI